MTPIRGLPSEQRFGVKVTFSSYSGLTNGLDRHGTNRVLKRIKKAIKKQEIVIVIITFSKSGLKTGFNFID